MPLDLPKETSIHTAKMTPIKIALSQIYYKDNKEWQIKEHRKEGRICSSICGYHQKMADTWTSLHLNRWNGSNKNSFVGDPQMMGNI